MLVFKQVPGWQQQLADELANRTIGRLAFVDGVLQGKDMAKLSRYPVYSSTIDGITKESYPYEFNIKILMMGYCSLSDIIKHAQEMVSSVPDDVYVQQTTSIITSICVVTTKQVAVNKLVVKVNVESWVYSYFEIVFDEFDLLTAKHGERVDLASDYKNFKLYKNVVTPKLDDKLFQFDFTCDNPAIHILTWRPGFKKLRLYFRNSDNYRKPQKIKYPNNTQQLRCDACHWHLYGKCYRDENRIVCAYCVHSKVNIYKSMQVVDAPVTTEQYVRSQFAGQQQDIILASLENAIEVQLSHNTKQTVHMIGNDRRYVLTSNLFDFLINPNSRHFAGVTIVRVGL